MSTWRSSDGTGHRHIGRKPETATEGFGAQPRTGLPGARQPGAFSFEHPVDDLGASGRIDLDFELHETFFAKAPNPLPISRSADRAIEER